MLFLLIVCAAVIGYAILIYNGLVARQTRVQEAWSTVETQLKRRYDLIPNLVETVKGYATHENKTLEQLVTARNMAMSMQGASVQKEQQENALSSTLKSLFALGESYPDLKASSNFLDLQQQLADTETKIQAAHQFYNTVVSDFNAKIRMFPNNLIATRFNFTAAPFFELEAGEKEAARKAPKVTF